jgi:hypothetical protein
VELHPTAFLPRSKSGLHTKESFSNNGEVTNKYHPSTRVCVLLTPTFIAVPKCFGSSGPSARNTCICKKSLLEIKRNINNLLKIV